MVVNGVVNGNKIKPAVTAVIQARMGSKRLPEKSMIDLAGKPMLAHVIERTLLIEGVDKVVVATSIGQENIPIIKLAQSMNVKVFVGSADNVLERYFLAVKEFGGEFIVRVTGDNPFTDPEYASMAVDISIESGSDLCALSNMPLGTAVEIIRAESLYKAYKHADKAYHKEHVTPYIKEHPEMFRIERPPVSFKNPFPDLRLTVDTPEDLKFARIIYKELYRGSCFALADVIEFLKNNPNLMEINRSIKQRSMHHADS